MRLLACSALLLAACGESNGTLVLPDLRDSESLIIAFHLEDELRVFANDVADLSAVSVDTEVEDAEIEVVAYNRTLAALGIAQGRLSPTPDGQPIPKGDLMFRRPIATDAWTPTSERSPKLRTLLVAREKVCTELEVRQSSYPPTEDTIRSKIALSTGEILIFFHRSQRTMHIIRGDDVESVRIPAMGLINDAFELEPGRLLVAEVDGNLYDTRFDGSTLTITASITPSRGVSSSGGRPNR